MSALGQKRDSEQDMFTLRYYYRSCSGRVYKNLFTIPYNIFTLKTEIGGIDSLLRRYGFEAERGPHHRASSCSKTIHIVTTVDALKRLSEDGWIFKQVELKPNGRYEAEYLSFNPNIQVELVKKGLRNENGEWYDVIRVNGKLYRVYKNRLEEI